MSRQGRLARINISPGGVPKLPIDAVLVSRAGLAGDRQRDLKHHGGPDRAVCLWSLEIIEELQREGHPIAPGATGENFTVAGLPWAELVPGVRLRVGAQLLLEITGYAPPCRTIWRSFRLRRYGRISQKKYPGQSRLYARVLEPGGVTKGDAVIVMPPA